MRMRMGMELAARFHRVSCWLEAAVLEERLSEKSRGSEKALDGRHASELVRRPDRSRKSGWT